MPDLHLVFASHCDSIVQYLSAAHVAHTNLQHKLSCPPAGGHDPHLIRRCDQTIRSHQRRGCTLLDLSIPCCTTNVIVLSCQASALLQNPSQFPHLPILVLFLHLVHFGTSPALFLPPLSAFPLFHLPAASLHPSGIDTIGGCLVSVHVLRLLSWH